MHQINTIPCPHCGARYKAPLTIPKEGGLITCAKCGETFTIFPEKKKEEVIKPKDEALYKQLPDDPFANIFVMKEDGTTVSVPSQAVLQQKIVTMEVGKNDSWSRDQKQWLPLANEPELAPFFDLVSLKITVGESVAPAPQALPPLSFNSDNEIETPRTMSKTLPPHSITKEIKAPAPEPTPEMQKEFLKNEFDEFDFDEPKSGKKGIIGALVAITIIGLGVGTYFFTDIFKPASTPVNLPAKVDPQPEKLPTMPPKNSELVKKDAEKKENNKKTAPDTPKKQPEKKIERVAEKTPEKQKPQKVAIKKEKPQQATPVKKVPRKKPAKKQVSAKSLVRYGWKLIDRGNSKKAIRIFRRAIKIEPGFAESYYGLAEAYGALGNTTKAKIYYKECLKHNPSATQKTEVQRILNNL